MSENKIIGVCAAGTDEEYTETFLQLLSQYGIKYHYKILYFYSFSPLFTQESHDFGERKIFRLINYDMLDGLIVLGQTIKCPEVIDSIVDTAHNKNIPIVAIDCQIKGCYNINFNYDKAMEQILVHLIEVHHVKRFNFIAGIKGNDFSERRLSIFRRVLQEHNIPVEEERIGYGDFWYGPTNEVMDRFLSSTLPFPEAIVCSNDSMAIAAYNRLSEAGYRVPEDVILTGFDGIEEALQHIPSLTTARHDYEGVVQAAYTILSNLFAGRKQKKQVWVDSRLLLAESCGCTSKQELHFNTLVRSMFSKVELNTNFNSRQIRMTADLTDCKSFQEVFEKIKDYADEFSNPHLWLCVVDNFLIEEEFSDILEESSHHLSGYSSKMDLMLCRIYNEWQGIMDFETKNLLPNLEEIWKETNNIVFFPLHVHDQTIGYAALSFDDGILDILHLYQFFMNISITLEVTKSHRRQQTIIQNLENKYVHDPLTGLFNRRGFYQKVTQMYQTCLEKQTPIMIISVDLNGLKPINDTYGHADGDIAISTVAKALITCAGQEDVCARFGGDEFVVAGTLSDGTQAMDYVGRVQNYLKHFNENSGKLYQVSASFGLVVAVPNDTITLDEFIRQADEKMYTEKAIHHLSRSR